MSEKILAKITKVQAKGVDASIAMYARTYGRQCDIYYPVDTGVYSGSEDDISYLDDPSEVMVLFIPKLFQALSRKPAMGHYDVLGTDGYYIITNKDILLPLFTKIVAHGPMGIVCFIVRNADYAATFEGSIFKRLEIEPILDSSQDNKVLEGLRISTSEKEQEFEIDNSTVKNDNKQGEYQFYLDKGDRNYHD